MKPNNHGGTRPGAGRKRRETPANPMHISVSQETFLKARALRKRGLKINQLIENFINTLYAAASMQDFKKALEKMFAKSE